MLEEELQPENPEETIPPNVTEADLITLRVKVDNLTTGTDIHRPMITRVAGLDARLHIAKIKGWSSESIHEFLEGYAEVKKWIVDREMLKAKEKGLDLKN